MFCLRLMRSFACSAPRTISSPKNGSRRALSSLHSPLRPALPSAPRSQQSTPNSASTTTTPVVDSTGLQVLDLMPKISTHPALLGTQIRCGPRMTFSPSHLKRKRRVGFLARKRTPSGRKILKARALKGRRSLSH